MGKVEEIEKSWAKLKLTKLKTRVLYIFDAFVGLYLAQLN